MKVLYNIHYRYFLLYIIITLLDVYYIQVLDCWMDWCRGEFTCDIHDESNNMIVLPYFMEAERGTLEHMSLYFHVVGVVKLKSYYVCVVELEFDLCFWIEISRVG